MSNSPSRAAPAFLASVRNASEAYEAFAAGADVIDCKDPARGALGRLDLDEIARIVKGVSALVPVSATIGDSFATPADGARAAEEVAATGVAIVKCGFFGAPEDGALLTALSSARLGGAKLFGVLMADRIADFSLVPQLARAGFIGVMLDTASKERGSLRQIMDIDRLQAFLAAVRPHQLAAGLAGSLRLGDIAPLAALGPDLLGFRGALCAEGRTGQLEEARVVAVRRALDVAAIAMQRSVA